MDGKAGNISCVIDGLDECDGDSVFHILDKFYELAARTNDGSAGHNFRFIILSRPNAPGQKLPQLHVDIPTVRLDPDSDKEVHSDIGVFIDKQIDDLANASPENRWPASLREQVARILHAKAGGTFLWVGFVMQDLRRKTPMEVRRCLKTIPAGLNGIYDRILKSVPLQHRQAVRSILQWVCLAEHPLRPSELAGLVEEKPTCIDTPTPINTDTASLSDSDSDEEMILDHENDRGTLSRLRSLLRFCNHSVLVATQTDPIQKKEAEIVHFVHQSAKDYLMRRERSQDDDLEYFRLRNHRTVHEQLGRHRIEVLMKEVEISSSQTQPSWATVSGLADSVGSCQRPYHFTSQDYAALSWAHHIRLGGCVYHHDDTHSRIMQLMSDNYVPRSVWAWVPSKREDGRFFHHPASVRSRTACKLKMAVCLGLSSTVKKLASEMTIENHTSVVQSPPEGILSLALFENYSDVFEILLASFGTTAVSLEPEILEEVVQIRSTWSSETVRHLISIVKDPKRVYGDYLEDALIETVYNDDEVLFLLLVEAGADPIWANHMCSTTLFECLLRGRDPYLQKYKRTKMFDHLLSFGLIGPFCGSRSSNGTDTLLHTAALYRDTVVIRRLLDAGERADVTNSSGQLPTHLAGVSHTHGRNMLEWQRGLTQLLVDSQHVEAFHNQIRPGRTQSQCTLINFKDSQGLTALHTAATAADPLSVEALLDCGADPTALDLSGRTPLMVILGFLFLGRLEAPSNLQWYWLQYWGKCAINSLSCIGLLRKSGVCGSKQDPQGRTVLHFLAEFMASKPWTVPFDSPYRDGLKFRNALPKFYANLDLRDDQGRTVRDIYPVKEFWDGAC